MGFYFQYFQRSQWMNNRNSEFSVDERFDSIRPQHAVVNPAPPDNQRRICSIGDSCRLSVKRGSSEYSDQSYDYQIEPSPDTSPMRDTSTSSPPPHELLSRDCLPQPQPLSYTELNRLPVVQLKGQDLTVKCCCDKPWEKDEEATLLLCGHHLHSTCACKLMETGVCPICKSSDVIEDKLREIRIDLSGFNF